MEPHCWARCTETRHAAAGSTTSCDGCGIRPPPEPRSWASRAPSDGFPSSPCWCTYRCPAGSSATRSSTNEPPPTWTWPPPGSPRCTGCGTRHLHAHFAHDPTLVALLTHLLTGIPYSFTAHARDLYQVPEPALVARAERATAVVTECTASVEYLASLLPAASASRVRIIHNGLSLHEFRPREHDGDGPGPPLLLSVGRLVETKGFGDLLAAS